MSTGLDLAQEPLPFGTYRESVYRADVVQRAELGADAAVKAKELAVQKPGQGQGIKALDAIFVKQVAIFDDALLLESKIFCQMTTWGTEGSPEVAAVRRKEAQPWRPDFQGLGADLGGRPIRDCPGGETWWWGT